MMNKDAVDGHLARLREDGFTVLRDAVAPNAVAALTDALDRIQRDHGLGP